MEELPQTFKKTPTYRYSEELPLATVEPLPVAPAEEWARVGVPDFDIPAPNWARDAVYSDTAIVFNWRDRLRILFRGRLSVSSITYTENPPGRTLNARFSVDAGRIFPRLFRRGGLLEVGEADARPLTDS